MSTLGKAVILFGADTALFRGDIGRAAHILEQGFARMQKAAFAGRVLIGGSFAATAVAMTAMSKSAIDQGDEFAKLSQKTGIQVERLSELKFAADLGNLSNEAYKKGLIEFNRSLVEATNSSSKAGRIYQALGVDIKAGPVEALRQLADRTKDLPEELRASIFREAFGKVGTDWIPMMAAGSRGLDEMAEKARGLGVVMSTEFAKQSEKFNDDLRTLTKSSEALGIALANKVLPNIAGLASRLAEAATQGRLAQGVIREAANATQTPDGKPLAIGGAGLGLFGAFVGAMDARGNRPATRLGSAADLRRMDNAMLGEGVSRPGKGGPDPEKVRAALASTDALQKRQIAALQQMEEKRKGLFNLNEQELMLERVKTGTYADFDAQTKVRLLNLALEIDLRKELIERIDAETAAAMVQADAREHGAELFKEFYLTGKDAVEQLEFETRLVGVAIRDQEKMNAVREIDLDLLNRKRRLAEQYGEDVAGLAQEEARLEREAQRQKRQTIALIEERQAKERDFLVGAKFGFDEYGDAATNAALNARDAVVSGFQHMEDALVEFARTGKFEFRDFANAVISDLTRIAIRQGVTGPLANSLGSWLAGGSGGIAGAQGVTAGDGINFALGGIMSSRGSIPLRRYSAGGVANSPQLAVFGEGSMNEAFVPLPDGRRIPVDLGGSGGGNVIHMPIHFSANTPAAVRDAVFALAPALEERAKNAVFAAQRRGVRA